MDRHGGSASPFSFCSVKTHGPAPDSGAGPAACDTELSGRSARRTRGQGHFAGDAGYGASCPPPCWSSRRQHHRNTGRQQGQRSHVAQQAAMIGSAVLIELGCQGRDLREDNDAKQKQQRGRRAAQNPPFVPLMPASNRLLSYTNPTPAISNMPCAGFLEQGLLPPPPRIITCLRCYERIWSNAPAGRRSCTTGFASQGGRLWLARVRRSPERILVRRRRNHPR